MKSRTLTLENGLFVLAFLLGLFIRLIHLGLAPLTDIEATWAMQALDLARGAHPLIGPQPGYVLLTGLLFYVFGDGATAARLLPALAGAGLILSPLLFRRWIGRWPAVALAFLLAFAPDLVAVSRQANGLIFTLSFSALAAGFLFNRRYAWAGIFAGLALLGGPGIWEGALIVGLALLWTALFTPSVEKPEAEEVNVGPAGVRVVPVEEKNGLVPPDWTRSLPWLAGTLLMVGVLLPLAFLVPSGLSALGSSLVAYLSGWTQAVQTPILQMLLALAAYTPLALLFGVLGMLSSSLRFHNPLDAFLTRWALIGMLLVLVNPARQPFDLIWALAPLWALSARQIVRMITGFSSDPWALVGQVMLVVILLTFAWLNFVHLSNPAVSDTEAILQVIKLSIYAALILLVIVSVLVGWGWLMEVAASGLAFGLGIVLAAFTLSGAWQAAGLGAAPGSVPLRDSPYIAQGSLLYKTALQLDDWNTPAGTNLDLTVMGVDSPALRWLLRNYEGARFVDVLPAEVSPSLLITPVQSAPQLASSYTGQDFILQQSSDWNLLVKNDWKTWWVVRKTPVSESLVVFWVRSDLFPGATQAGNVTQ